MACDPVELGASRVRMGQQVGFSVTGISDLFSGDESMRPRPDGAEFVLPAFAGIRRLTENLIALDPMPPVSDLDYERLLCKD